MVIKAKAFKTGMTDSETAMAIYTIDIATPSGGTLPQTVMYVAFIIGAAAIVGVMVLLLRKPKHLSSNKQYKAKPKLKKD